MKRANCLVLVASFVASAVQGQEKSPAKEFTNSVGMKFVWIRPGSFMMGSPKEEEARESNESLHKVMLTKGFYLGVYPVTQEQWRAVMGVNPSRFKGKMNLPVETVSCDDCQEFFRTMGANDGRAYRLRLKTTPVGSFPPNEWGLYDMHGNVWQWCLDSYGEYPQSAVIDPKRPSQMLARISEFALQLGSLKFAERSAATKALNDIGEPALPALRKMVDDARDLETCRHAQLLVAAITDIAKLRVLRGGSFVSPASFYE